MIYKDLPGLKIVKRLSFTFPCIRNMDVLVSTQSVQSVTAICGSLHMFGRSTFPEESGNRIRRIEVLREMWD
jgi:hypothetical protein